MAKAIELWKLPPQLLWLPQNYSYAFTKALPRGSVLSVTLPNPKFFCKPGGEGPGYLLPCSMLEGSRGQCPSLESRMNEFEPAVTKAVVAMGQMTCIHDRQHGTP